MDCTQLIENIIVAAEAAHGGKQGDYYGADGLLYCGLCNTPKQCRLEILGRIRTPHCLCKCATEARDREEKERKQRDFITELTDLWHRWGFSLQDMKHYTFENDDMSNPRIMQAMKNYVENFPEFQKQGQGLLLFGDVGTGKTFAAVAVANALIKKGYPVLVTNFTQICNIAGGLFDEKQNFYNYFNRFALLVIDDLAAERKTEYMQEIVYNVIDSRYRAGLPMIITTNLTSEELKKPQEMSNKRIFDRVLERCLPVEVTGENRRHKKLAESASELKAKLGL